MTAAKANIKLTGNFTLVAIVLVVGITTVQCKRSCVSCRKSFAQCNYTTGVCNSNCQRTKRCNREDDLCLATWSWIQNKLVMFTSCFRRPPFSSSSRYNAKCEAETLNGTRTCLCQGSECNRNPSEPVLERMWQDPTSETKKKQIRVLIPKQNLTKDSPNSERTEEIPLQNNTTKQVSMVVWIGLAAILIPFLLAGLIHSLRACNRGHLEKNLLDNPSESELDEGSIKHSNNINSFKTLEQGLAHERYSIDLKDHSKKLLLNENSTSELEGEIIKTHDGINMRLEKVLAQGKYSDVWRGRFRGQSVAAKIFPAAAISSWRRERYIYTLLLGEHSNILKLLSLKEAETPQQSGEYPICLMMEFYQNGSLRDYLKSRDSALSWSEAVVIASGITNGVAYLHSDRIYSGRRKISIAHRDLKSTNILVRKDGTCVISDFGLSVSLDSVKDESKNLQVGTYRYMSPEELLATVGVDSTDTFKQMDIYSMALVLWEVISQCDVTDCDSHYQLPFEDIVGEDATLSTMVDVVALKNYRPHLPNKATSHEDFELFCQTVQECWDPDPEARLTADCAQTRLKELLLMMNH